MSIFRLFFIHTIKNLLSFEFSIVCLCVTSGEGREMEEGEKIVQNRKQRE